MLSSNLRQCCRCAEREPIEDGNKNRRITGVLNPRQTAPLTPPGKPKPCPPNRATFYFSKEHKAYWATTARLLDADCIPITASMEEYGSGGPICWTDTPEPD
jgi:hypothetical protein